MAVLPKSNVLLCVSCKQKDSIQRIFIKKCFPFYGGKCLSRKAVHNWAVKFCQGHLKVADDARPGRRVEVVTEATVQRVEEMIRAGRKITIDSVSAALGCSHGLEYSIMHECLKFRKVCARWMSRKLKDREKICSTELLLGTNHGCIITNPNKIVLQLNGNIPVHLQLKCLRL
jgi:hypothetical protein